MHQDLIPNWNNKQPPGIWAIQGCSEILEKKTGLLVFKMETENKIDRNFKDIVTPQEAEELGLQNKKFSKSKAFGLTETHY